MTDHKNDPPPDPKHPQFAAMMKAWLTRNADRLEDDVSGRAGLHRLVEFIERHGRGAEAQMVAAWYQATGELPPEDSEADRLAKSFERESRALAQHVENIANSATTTERQGGTSTIQGAQLQRAQTKRRQTGGETTAQERQRKAEELRGRIVDRWDDLARQGKPEHARAGIIAEREGITAKTVRDHLRKANRR